LVIRSVIYLGKVLIGPPGRHVIYLSEMVTISLK